MMRTYYFRKNETDFCKWYRYYVKRAIQYIRSYENNNFRVYFYYDKQEYKESLVIVRQYRTLMSSLTVEQRKFFNEYLIDNREYPYNCFPYKDYYTLIFHRWKEICFPQHKSRIKTVDKYQLGKTIKIIRMCHGMSRRQVAELLQINEKTFASYESGERLVRADVLFGLAQIFDMSIDSIIEESMPVCLLYK